jgi:hypothetical protein
LCVCLATKERNEKIMTKESSVFIPCGVQADRQADRQADKDTRI